MGERSPIHFETGIKVDDFVIENALHARPWAKDYLKQLKDHNKTTYDHCQNVARIATDVYLCTSPDRDASIMTTAGLVHDIGKLYIPEDILESGMLFVHRQHIKNHHVREGVKIVAKHDPIIAEIIAAHHEFQESPYPRKTPRPTKDPEIAKMQIILAISDKVDSLLSPRSYKKPWSVLEAYSHLSRVFPDKTFLNYALASKMQLND